MEVKRSLPWHLPCFASFAALRLFVNNLAVVAPAELPRSLLASFALSILLGIVTLPITRDWRRSALVASVATAMFFSTVEVVKLLAPQISFDSATFEQGMVYAGFAAILLLVGWKWKNDLTPVFNRIGLVLVVMLAGQAALSSYNIQKGLAMAARNKNSETKTATVRPDIFYIILDGYGRTDSLAHYMGFDNRFFVEGLKERGFYVAEDSHSNYLQTEQSLCSSLNMQYLQDLFGKIPDAQKSRALLDNGVDENLVAERLRSYGYAYIGMATGFDSTRMRSADLLLEQAQDLSLFEMTLINQTPLQGLVGSQGSIYKRRYNMLREAFDTLEDLAKPTERPRFVFAHIVAPHPPFVIAEDGSMSIQKGLPWGYYDASDYLSIGGTHESYKKGYSAQAKWVSHRVLQMLDRLLANQKSPPIVLIQGDHGSKSHVQADSLKDTDVREPFRNLSSYYVPDSIRSKLYPSITPVNSFRLILSELFGEQLPLLKDESYFSPWSYPFQFANVTEQVRRPLDQATAQSMGK